MMTFIVESAVIWGLGLVFYQLLLKRETFFQLNRFYLIFILVAGSILPIFNIQLGSYSEIFSYSYPALEVMSTSVSKLGNGNTGNSGSFNWVILILSSVYISGVLLALFKLGKNLFTIAKILQASEKILYKEFTEVQMSHGYTPFSFFRWMFIPEDHIHSQQYELIKKHELAHIKNLHSVDILLIELLRVVFWFNPLLSLFKKEIVQIHEYKADEWSLEHAERFDYGKLLLSFNYRHSNFYLGNQLNNSIIKNRLTMMYKNKSGQTSQLKYLLVLPFIAMLFFMFSCEQKETFTADSEEVKLENESSYSESLKSEVFTVVEEMPRFPGCEELEGTTEEKQKCASNKMVQYIFGNLKYPAKAREEGIEGTVVVQFVVDEKGKIIDSKIARDIGYGCGDEVLKIVDGMNDMEEKWIPGKQRGEKVKVQFSLPVKFKLEDKE